MKGRSIFLALWLTVLFLTSCSLGEPPAAEPAAVNSTVEPTADPEDPAVQDALQYAEDMGVSPEEAVKWMAVQQAVAEAGLESALMANEADTFAGLWLQHEPAYRVVVAFTRDGEQTVQPYVEGESFASFVEVRDGYRYTLGELREALEQAMETLRQLGIDASGGIDVEENRVALTVGNPALLQEELAAAGLALPEPVVVEAIDPDNLSEALRGGVEMYEGPDGQTIYFPCGGLGCGGDRGRVDEFGRPTLSGHRMERTMQRFTRLLFLMIIAFAFGACSRQTSPEATVPSVAKESEPEEESSPVATTTPVPTSSREPSTSAAALVPSPTPAPTETALPSPTPSATPLYCPEGAPADSVTTRPLRVFFVERGNLRVWDEALDTTETLVEGGFYRLYLSPDEETIAFLRQEAPGMIDASKQMALWTVDAGGGNERLLIDGDNFRAMGPERVGDIDVEVVNPIRIEWLPGTETLAFGLNIMGPSQCCGSARQVRLVDTATGAQRMLILTESDSTFTFSPDGRCMTLSDYSSIVLLELEDGATTGSRLEDVVTYPHIGLGHGAYQARPIWADDGKEFSVPIPSADPFGGDATLTVWEVAAADGAARELATFNGFPMPFGVNVGSAIFSPDRSQIAFYRTPERSNEGDLLIAGVEGEWQVVYDSGWGPRFLGWSPDGSHFAYTVGYGRQRRLLRIGRLCESPIIFEGPPPVGDTPVTWLDGERFLYQTQRGQAGPTTLLLGALDGTVREIGQLSERLDSYSFIPSRASSTT